MDDDAKREKLAKAREKAKLVRQQKKERERQALQDEIDRSVDPPPVGAPNETPPPTPVVVSDDEEEVTFTITIKKKGKAKLNGDVLRLMNWCGNFGNTGR